MNQKVIVKLKQTQSQVFLFWIIGYELINAYAMIDSNNQNDIFQLN